ncbi:phosphoribosylaminoimidazole carboxylase [Fusarium sporotrichioides]|uniref:Phosphoribosylaminoimidazole carboxylase n=1 Tax=Fusarium sporotrichioides TaxID=5514 RepID=A0A395SBE4_FUSSP|nr:phosphoribosylaminoimidazole carboxylase [Fusarium sporotrichioides]
MSGKPELGLLGGGQLGRMLCEAASPLEVEIAILDAQDAPAKQVSRSKYHVDGSFKDPAKIRELASHCKVLSVETEHIETAVLEELSKEGKVVVYPSWKTLRLIQDKYEQKDYLGKQGIPIAEQVAVQASGSDEMRAALKDISNKYGLPFMLKSRKDSYDGRGNIKIANDNDIETAVAEFGNLQCYAEKYVPFQRELSVIVIRTEDADGKTKRLVPYPAVETVHEDNVCSRVYMPPRDTPDDVSKRAQEVAVSVVEKLWGRGVFAVEMFVTENNDILVNEIAPRPHNSGHLTIEAVPYMSQYKAQLTSILDEPLPEKLEPHVSSSIMINILGGASPESHLPLVKKAKSMFAPKIGVYPHLYGKQSKPGRKIGHITLTGLEGSIKDLEGFAQPLVQLAADMRQERIQAKSKAMRPEQATTKTSKGKDPLVLVTMGSDSDLPVLKAGLDILTQFGVPWEVDITSAHRTPVKMGDVAIAAADRGIKVIIAAAGGAAHLPGMISAYTPLPVIGVPVKATHLDGMDSLLSIVQMPRGVPTATVGINNSTNAALLAIRILGAFIPDYLEKMKGYQTDIGEQVNGKATRLRESDVESYLAQMKKG